LPEFGAEGYLFEAFIELGCAQAVGMGVGPLSWVEITSFATATATISEPWEFRAIRRMSECYLAEYENGKKPLVIPPAERDGGA